MAIILDNYLQKKIENEQFLISYCFDFKTKKEIFKDTRKISLNNLNISI